jgi:hypothetical protein
MHLVCCVYTSPLVTASHLMRSLSSGFPNCSRASATETLVHCASPTALHSTYKPCSCSFNNCPGILSSSWCQVATDVQSASLSRFWDPIWNSWPDFFLSDNCGSLTVECPLWRKNICNLLVQLFLGLVRTHGHIIQSHLRLHQPGGPGPRNYTPRNTVTQLYS